MAEAFELYASFKIDTSEYKQELNKIRQEMQQFQQELNSFAVHPTFDGGRFRSELQQAQQQSTQATEEIQRLQQQIQSLQQAADGNGGSGDSGGGVLSGFLSQLDVIGDIASGQFLANMAVNGINSIIDGITGSIGESIELASGLVETQNVVDVTFEDSADTINKWAQDALNAYGITETKAKQYSSTLGAMLKSMGIADDQVLQMSMDMAGLAADMASFYNLDHDTAFEKIRSGISGETEPLKALGLNLSVANLNAFALEKGMTKTFDKMTQAEQATLRYQYLLEATKDAQGDFARTGDSYSNEMRKLQTNLDRIKTEFGKGLLGVVTPAVSMLNNLLSDKSYQYTDIEKIYAERNESLYDAQATYAESMAIVNAMRNMEDESGEAVKSTKAWQEALEDLKNVMPGLSQYVDLTSDAIMGNTDAINQYVDAVNGVTVYNTHENAVQSAQATYDKTAQELASKQAHLQYLQSLIDAGNTPEVLAAAKETRQVAYEWFKSVMTREYPEISLPNAYEDYQSTVASGAFSSTQYVMSSYNPTLYDAYAALGDEEDKYANQTELWREEAAQTEQEIAELNVSLNEQGAAVRNTTAEWEAYKKAHPEVEAQVKYDKAIEDEKKALEDLKTALKDVETYRADTLKKAQESYKGVASGMGYMVTHTREEMTKLLNTDYSKENVLSWYGTNADALHAYNEALQRAEASGVDVGILEGLTTYSRDNDAYLSQLLNLTPEEIQQLNADYQRARDEENAMAETKTRYALANDETYQAMLETIQKSLEAFEQKDAIAAYMAENDNALLAGIDAMRKTLEAEIPGINALLEQLGFEQIDYEIKDKPWVHDFGGARAGYADLFDDVANDKNTFSKDEAKAQHAIEARARSGYADMIEDGLMPDDIKARAQRWNRLVEMKTQEMNDIVDILEQRMEENQRQREEEEAARAAKEARDNAQPKTWSDLSPIISSEEFRNADSYEPVSNEKTNIFALPQTNKQEGSRLETFDEYRTRTMLENSRVMQDAINSMVETFKMTTQQSTPPQGVAISNPQDLANYLQQPITVVNNFSVDGTSVATVIAPIVNKSIGKGIRGNLMEVAR